MSTPTRFPVPIRALPIVGILLGLLLLLGCTSPDATDPAEAEKERPKLFVVGIDSLSWAWIDSLIDAGMLPHLGALRDRGYAADLETVEPVISPTNWTSIATGRSTDGHGVDNFFANRRHVRAPAVWERFAAAGLRVGVYDYLITWPPRPLPGGFVIPGWLRRDGSTWPPDLQERFADDPIYTYEILDMGDLDDTVAEIDEELERRSGDLLRLVDAFDTDVAFTTFYAVDVVSHRFYHTWDPGAFDPRIPFEPRFTDRIGQTLEQLDAALGDLVAGLGPEDHLVLVSDHGSRPSDPVFRAWGLAMDSLVAQAFPGLEMGDDPSAALLAGIRVPSDDGGSLPVRTVCSFVEGAIAVGEGNGGEGDAGEEGEAGKGEAVVRRLVEAIEAFRMANGEPVFRARVLTEPAEALEDPEAAGLGAFETELIGPNLPADAFVLVAVNEEVRSHWPDGEVHVGDRTLRLGDLLQSHDFTGDHHPTAFFLAAGPAIVGNRGEDRGQLSVLDVAPLLHALVGLPIPDDLEGRSPDFLLDPAFLERRPLRTVAAADWPEIPLPDDATAVDAEEEVDDDLMKQRLRSLGYVR